MDAYTKLNMFSTNKQEPNGRLYKMLLILE